MGGGQYIRLPTALVYLACVLDAWSRRCIGWQLSRTIDTRLHSSLGYLPPIECENLYNALEGHPSELVR